MSAMSPADCWNHTGVSGDRSCPELERLVHCRNCAAYTDVARQSLHAPVEDSYQDFWARELSQVTQEATPTDSAAVVFRIAGEWLAVPAALVRSVAPSAPAHRIPHRNAPGLLGVVNVGSRLLPAVSLGALLGIDSRQAPLVGDRHVFARLLVVEAGHQPCALPVAELHGVVRYAAAALAEPAETVERPRPEHLDGVLAHRGMQVGVLNGALLAQRITELLR
ncbi:MAG TPA: chemotaxis protein CheW [Telluria sp.]|nr:chemotaxis protein CheW [Telluria sp.]